MACSVPLCAVVRFWLAAVVAGDVSGSCASPGLRPCCPAPAMINYSPREARPFITLSIPRPTMPPVCLFSRMSSLPFTRQIRRDVHSLSHCWRICKIDQNQINFTHKAPPLPLRRCLRCRHQSVCRTTGRRGDNPFRPSCRAVLCAKIRPVVFPFPSGVFPGFVWIMYAFGCNAFSGVIFWLIVTLGTQLGAAFNGMFIVKSGHLLVVNYANIYLLKTGPGHQEMVCCCT